MRGGGGYLGEVGVATVGPWQGFDTVNQAVPRLAHLGCVGGEIFALHLSRHVVSVFYRFTKQLFGCHGLNGLRKAICPGVMGYYPQS